MISFVPIPLILHFPKVRENLRPNDMLLCQPSVFFQSVLDVIRIKLCKGFKVHVKVSGIL